MHVHTRQSLANCACSLWRAQYGGKQSGTYGQDKAEKLTSLEALGSCPDPDAVDAVIGNTSWTTPQSCGECRSQSGYIVEVGEDYDYESHTAFLCIDCLKKAFEAAAAAMEATV